MESKRLGDTPLDLATIKEINAQQMGLPSPYIKPYDVQFVISSPDMAAYNLLCSKEMTFRKIIKSITLFLQQPKVLLPIQLTFHIKVSRFIYAPGVVGYFKKMIRNVFPGHCFFIHVNIHRTLLLTDFAPVSFNVFVEFLEINGKEITYTPTGPKVAEITEICFINARRF